MSIYTPNLDKFTAQRFVAPLDSYELEVINASAREIEFTNKATEMKEKKPVVGFLLKIVKGDNTGTEYTGKPVSADFWLGEDDDSWNQLLRFVGAVKGIKFGDAEGDEQFKQMMATADLSVNAAAKELGTAYTDLKGGRVRCTLSMKPDKNDASKQYQKFGTWTAV